MYLTNKECDYIINALTDEYEKYTYANIISKIQDHKNLRKYSFISDDSYYSRQWHWWFALITNYFDSMPEWYWLNIDYMKSKYGWISIFSSWGNSEQDDHIWKLEEESFSTCETCGNGNAEQRDWWWIFTLCDKCHELRNSTNNTWMN